MPYVQVRVKVEGDGMTWSTRPVVAEFQVVEVDMGGKGKVLVHPMSGLTLTEKVHQIAVCYEDVTETRWNWKESVQGHYTLDNGNVE